MRNSAIRALAASRSCRNWRRDTGRDTGIICAGAYVRHRNPIKKGPLSMTHRIAPSLRGSLAAGISITALVLGVMVALAQQPPPAAPPKPAAPKPAAPAA